MPVLLPIADLGLTPTVLNDKLSTAWCAERAGAVYRALQPAMDVQIEAVKAAEVVEVKGRLRGSFGFDCSRCAEAAELAIDEPFSHHYVGQGELDAGEETDEFDADPDVSEHDGVRIELDELLVEVALLALPAVPLCDPDCKGLCPQCGSNLNRETCGCQPASLASPTWAALRDFKVN